MNDADSVGASLTDPTQAGECNRKSRLFWRLYAVFVVAAFAALPIAGCSTLFWLPDVVLPSRWIHVDGVALPNGQELHLFQRWSYDFYLTAVACKENGRYAKVFYVDGDDSKRWWWKVRLDPEKEMAAFTLSGHDYTYHWPDGAFRSVEDLIGVYTYDEIDLKKELLERPGDWDRLSE